MGGSDLVLSWISSEAQDCTPLSRAVQSTTEARGDRKRVKCIRVVEKRSRTKGDRIEISLRVMIDYAQTI